ncbi:MAG: hypothetical protein ACPG4U_14355, partial [Pseudomonadales bacterium]
ETENAVSNMDAGKAKVTDGIDISHKVASLLEQIIATSTDVAAQVDQIASTAEQQSAVTKEIAQNTDRASQLSQTVNNSITQVVTTSKEVADSSSAQANKIRSMITIIDANDPAPSKLAS